MDKPVAAAPTGAKEKVEKQARQLAYDVRYKTKQSLAQKSGGKMDPAQVQKAYMSQLAKSPAPPAVKSRAKQMLMGEDYKSDLGRLVSNSAASALYKVFVEHHQKDANGKVIEHDDTDTTPSSVEEDKTVLSKLTENGEELDMFDAVVAYLIDEGFAETLEEAQKIMSGLKPELVEEVYQNQLKKISK